MTVVISVADDGSGAIGLRIKGEQSSATSGRLDAVGIV
jgi:hypothetical protein